VCKPIAVTIAFVLLSAVSLAQEPTGTRRGTRFHPAHTVAVTEVRNGDPILGLAGGTVWLEVMVDENAKIENVTTRRGIEGLTPHVVRWVRTWTWKAAELDGSAMSSIVGVAVTVNLPSSPISPPLFPLKESLDPARSPSQFLPPQLISAVSPMYPNTNLLYNAVALDVTVNEMGEPAKVQVLRDVPPLTAAAIDSLKAWKFAPASLDGKPVTAQVTLAFVYRSPANNFPLGR
jgi:hypothetical protein